MSELDRKVREEKKISEKLLLNILPQPIAERLKRGEHLIAENFPEVTVLFSDIVNFTEMSRQLPAGELVAILNEVFSAFDRLAEKYHLEKIKTVGDSYMVVGGVPTPHTDHAEAVAEMALEMQEAIKNLQVRPGRRITMRTGVHTGQVVAGVIGEKKFIYDLWGDTANTASRMESYGQPGRIHVTQEIYERLKGKYTFDARGETPIKGKGSVVTYFLDGGRRFLPVIRHFSVTVGTPERAACP